MIYVEISSFIPVLGVPTTVVPPIEVAPGGPTAPAIVPIALGLVPFPPSPPSPVNEVVPEPKPGGAPGTPIPPGGDVSLLPPNEPPKPDPPLPLD